MCIKMRKIIFRIDTTFLVHKSKEITSRREYYFFAQIQEITIFPCMFMFWYLISSSFLSFPPLVWWFSFHPSLSATNSASKFRKEPCVAAVELVLMSFSVRGGVRSSLILLSLCLVLQRGTWGLFELRIPDPILHLLDGNVDSGCQWITGKYWTGKPFWLTLWIIIWN